MTLNDSGNIVRDEEFEARSSLPAIISCCLFRSFRSLPYRGRFTSPITANQCYCLLIKEIIAMFYDRILDQLSKEMEQNE